MTTEKTGTSPEETTSTPPLAITVDRRITKETATIKDLVIKSRTLIVVMIKAPVGSTTTSIIRLETTSGTSAETPVILTAETTKRKKIADPTQLLKKEGTSRANTQIAKSKALQNQTAGRAQMTTICRFLRIRRCLWRNKVVKNETIRSKFGIERNLLTVYSFLYDEGRKSKKKVTESIFKEINKEIKKEEPTIANEAAELTDLYENEKK